MKIGQIKLMSNMDKWQNLMDIVKQSKSIHTTPPVGNNIDRQIKAATKQKQPSWSWSGVFNKCRNKISLWVQTIRKANNEKISGN